jgi:hypothetical protein
VGDSLYGGSAGAPFHQLQASGLSLVDAESFPDFPRGLEAPPPQTFLDSRSRLGLS